MMGRSTEQGVRLTNARASRRLTRLAIACVLLCFVVVGGAYAYGQATGNLHEVEAGRFYRSAQLDAATLDATLKRYGIRTVLNLRGRHAGDAWYDEEVATTTAHGATHLDYAISARRRLTVPQMRELIAIIEAAPKPILVHCQQGADRTGLVSALYRLSRGDDAASAAQELSLRYGHFPWLGSETRAMDESLRDYLAASAPTLQPAY